MTKEEKAREIIRQNGECGGFMCESNKKNKCPCWDICTSGEDDPEIRVKNCKEFLDELKECLPDGVYENGNLVNKIPVKTLLDEFAMVAMAAIVGKMPLGTCDEDEEDPEYRMAASGAYSYAAAMMAEKARRELPH